MRNQAESCGHPSPREQSDEIYMYSKHWKFLIVELHHLVILLCTLSGHSKIDKTNVLMPNGSLMEVESIVECSP